MSPDQVFDSIAARQCKALFEVFAPLGVLGSVPYPEVWNVLRSAIRGAPEPISGALRLAIYTKIDPETGCHVWQRALLKGEYGTISIDGRDVQTHRYAYELANGPIPAALVIDHLCRNKACCNPAHLEAVTSGENTRRGRGFAGTYRHGFCQKAHPMDGRLPSGRLYCKVCHKDRLKRRRIEKMVVI